jgi:hypothetical protein
MFHVDRIATLPHTEMSAPAGSDRAKFIILTILVTFAIEVKFNSVAAIVSGPCAIGDSYPYAPVLQQMERRRLQVVQRLDGPAIPAVGRHQLADVFLSATVLVENLLGLGFFFTREACSRLRQTMARPGQRRSSCGSDGRLLSFQ